MHCLGIRNRTRHKLYMSSNKIFNYFASSNKTTDVFVSPITINAKVAKSLISKKIKKEDLNKSINSLLHVCFDYDSKIIYVPNASDFSKENMEYMLDAVKLRITKDFGYFSLRPPILGSPYSSLRVRSINGFSHAKNIIEKNYIKYNEIPIIEAYLPRMPKTTKMLPKQFNNQDFVGGYVSSEFANSITFLDEIDINGKKRDKPINLLTQSTPFILINIARTEKRQEPTATEKEWAVLSGYRDYLNDKNIFSDEINLTDLNKYSDLYAIKRYLYLGWSIEEVSGLMLNSVSNIKELINGIDLIMESVKSLEIEGHKNIALNPYYYSFKIDSSFPIKIDSLINITTGKINKEIQYDNLMICDYNRNVSCVIIKSPIFISPDICKKILNAKNDPFIVKYNSIVSKIDVKSSEKTYLEINKDQLYKIKKYICANKDDVSFRRGDLASGMSYFDSNIYNIRKISDYLYACDYIKKMCKENNVVFNDLDVIVGPIEKSLGSGVQGGFIDHNFFIKNKIEPPFEIFKDVFISPLSILINSATMPSYADQTETLIHEYMHYIYSLKNPNYEVSYVRSKNKGQEEEYKYWNSYFSDLSEIVAHKEQIKFELKLGKSYDEIIRNKVGGQITEDNYPIAVKFSELVQKSLNELEVEAK